MRIVEIFKSIQGEGFHSGKLALFIRLHGCNLKCSFCDEPLHKKDASLYADWLPRHLAEHTAELAKESNISHIIVTGGEPTLNDDLPLLCELLKSKGFYVQIETNGFNHKNWQHASFITWSPKADFKERFKAILHSDYLSSWRHIATTGRWEIKVPYGGDLDAELIVNELEKALQKSAAHHILPPVAKWLTPVNGMKDLDMENVKKAIQLIEKIGKGWRLNTQVHKVLGLA